MTMFLPQAPQKRPSFSQRLNAGIGQGLESAQQLMEQHKQEQALSKFPELKGLPPELQKVAFSEMLKLQGKEKLLGQKSNMISEIFSPKPKKEPSFSDQIMNDQQQPETSKERFDPTEISDEQILELSAIDPQLGATARQLKDTALREKRAEEKLDLSKEKNERSKFESERSFHTGFSKEAQKKASQLRESLPKKEMALDLARNAIESKDLGFFSLDKLADITGSDLFRTSKGAQLITAGKENLLSNMSRVSAKAQNIWFEQRLNSMFPKIGQSLEANETIAEMLEGEEALDKAYLNAYDRIVEEDEKTYGFERKDSEKRARDSIKPLEKEILKRTSYRLRELEEQEMGLNSLKSKSGKNVTKGTPLTLAMAKIYKEKFGDKALDVAKKNGYYIPTLEEFAAYRKNPSEFREDL